VALNPNASYPTKTAAPTADYPYGAARNITTPGDLTGTPLDEAWLNDWFGFQAAAIDGLSGTPSGSSDTALVSQVWDAIERLCPPGSIVMGPLISGDPTVSRLLPLSGQVVQITQFPKLVDVAYVGDGNNSTVAAAGGAFYKSSDSLGATPNIAGPYFVLPDAAGLFPRAAGDSLAVYDPDGSRWAGEVQDYAALVHYHPIRPAGAAAPVALASVTGSLAAGSTTFYQSTPSSPSSAIVASELTDVAQNALTKVSSDEVRPVNMAFNFYIRY
jgi:hypothetical protein